MTRGRPSCGSTPSPNPNPSSDPNPNPGPKPNPSPNPNPTSYGQTLVVGLGSTKFRSAQYTSHEVVVDEEQIAWFEKTIADHPASEGWKVFCFSHAPIIGSGLRVLQERLLLDGCSPKP